MYSSKFVKGTRLVSLLDLRKDGYPQGDIKDSVLQSKNKREKILLFLLLPVYKFLFLNFFISK